MNKESVLTKERLHKLLHFDPTTGVWTWLAKPAPKSNKRIGTEAGTYVNGYRKIVIDRRFYMSHRLAFFYLYGAWPCSSIDHINGDKSDNRITNLRLATHAENCRNRSAQSNNTTGFKGVCFDKSRDKFLATITINRRQLNLGRFNTPQAAYSVYCRAATVHHKHFARTK